MDSVIRSRSFNHYRGAIVALACLTRLEAADTLKTVRVITETGKQHEAKFVKLQNDTVYLLVPKGSGAYFSISGHKARFKEIRFVENVPLDLTLSDYPPHSPPPSVDSVPSWDTTTKSVDRLDSAALATLADAPEERPKRRMKSTGSTAARQKVPSEAIAEMGPPGAAAHITTRPSGAQIYVDDSLIGTSPITLDNVKPGTHHLRAAKDRYTGTAAMDLKSGSISRIRIPLKKGGKATSASTRPRKKHGGLAVVSGVLLAGGGTLYYFAQQDFRQASDARNVLESSVVPGPNYQEMLAVNEKKSRDGHLKSTLASAALAAGAAGIGLSIILAF